MALASRDSVLFGGGRLVGLTPDVETKKALFTPEAQLQFFNPTYTDHVINSQRINIYLIEAMNPTFANHVTGPDFTITNIEYYAFTDASEMLDNDPSGRIIYSLTHVLEEENETVIEVLEGTGGATGDIYIVEWTFMEGDAFLFGRLEFGPDGYIHTIRNSEEEIYRDEVLYDVTYGDAVLDFIIANPEFEGLRLIRGITLVATDLPIDLVSETPVSIPSGTYTLKSAAYHGINVSF